MADIRNRKLGFVFQSFNLLARTSALENVELPMLYGEHRLTRAELHERAKGSGFGRPCRARRSPSQSAFGRPATARGHCPRARQRPGVVLADEPTGNLDSHTSIEIMGIFQKLNDAGHHHHHGHT